jgi:hypothetical protein
LAPSDSHLALWAVARPRLPADAPGRIGAGSVAVSAAVGLGAVSDLSEAARTGLGGGAAVPVSMSEAYVERAVAANDDATLVVLEGVGHFEPIDPTTTTWETAVTHLKALLA